MNGSAAIRFGPFELHPARRQLTANGQAVAIGSRAMELLLALVARRDCTVSKDELLDLVWPDVIVEEANLHVHVSALRKVLGPQAIATVPGRGYRFVAPIEDEPAAAAPALSAPSARALPRPASRWRLRRAWRPVGATASPGWMRPRCGSPRTWPMPSRVRSA